MKSVPIFTRSKTRPRGGNCNYPQSSKSLRREIKQRLCDVTLLTGDFVDYRSARGCA